jgi:hypothetical protein
MKYFLITLLVVLGLTSCTKEDIGPPNPPEPIVTDSTQIDTAYNLVGQVWVISQYRVGEFGNLIPLSDTIEFIDLNTYVYNGIEGSYSFYPTASAFNLTLNFTPFGNLSGAIYQGNLNMGVMNGLKFTDITMGSGNGTNYYFWMTRQ